MQPSRNPWSDLFLCGRVVPELQPEKHFMTHAPFTLPAWARLERGLKLLALLHFSERPMVPGPPRRCSARARAVHDVCHVSTPTIMRTIRITDSHESAESARMRDALATSGNRS